MACLDLGIVRVLVGMVQVEAVLELAVVVLVASAGLGQTDQVSNRSLRRQIGQPVIGGRLGVGGPFDRQPVVRQDHVPPDLFSRATLHGSLPLEGSQSEAGVASTLL